MANDENKIILEFPATNVEIEFGETITFDNISGFLNSDRVTYNGESLTEEIAHLENDKADNTKIAPEYDEEETYYRGDIVLYNGVLYECDNTDASGEFNPSDWKEITLGEGIEDVRDLLDSDYYTKSQSDYRFLGKTNPTGSGYFGLNRSGSAGANSVSVGWHNVANAQSSFSEGESNTSSGYASHSEGYGNAASGLMAHAEGVTTESSGYASHSEGVGTIANHIGQHVFGTYNVADTSTAEPTAKGNYIEIVGNGTDDDRRRNARTLDWRGNEMLMGDLTFNGNKSLTGEISRLDGRIDNLPEAMVFKGTLGVNGDIQTLPTASAEIEGWTFKCITAGTYAGLTLKVGDSVTCFNPPNTSVYEWDISGYGDTDTDTWRSIKVNGEEALGSGISSGSVDFEDTANVKFEFDADGNKISATLDSIYTDSEVDDLLEDKADADNTYTKAQVDDIVYNILPDDTASGSVANFETDLALPIKSLEVDVDAVQDLHGQSSAYPAGGSAQIWDEELEAGYIDNDTGGNTSSYPNRARSKNYISVTPETAYYFLSKNNVPVQVLGYDTNKGYIGIVKSMATSQSFTTLANCYYIRFKTTADYALPYKNDFAINYPSTDTNYHPYSNICPISGWSEIDIPKTGKNLANIAVSSSIHWGTDTSDLVQLLNTLPVGYYTVSNKYRVDEVPSSGKVLHGAFLIRALVNGEQVNVTSYLLTTDNNPTVGKVYQESVSFEITEAIKGNINHAYRYCDQNDPHSGSNRGSYTCYDIQLEVGSTVSDYVAYNGNTEVINLGGTYYGGKLTQDKDGHRQFEVTCAKEHISLQGKTYDTANGFDAWLVYLTNRSLNAGSSANKLCSVCNNYRYEGSSANIEHYYIASQAVVIYLAENTFRDGEFDIVYPLATPYVIDLPDGEPINTLIGTNNIFANTGDTSVIFKDSVNGYIEKKIASVQALALNT